MKRAPSNNHFIKKAYAPPGFGMRSAKTCKNKLKAPFDYCNRRKVMV